MYQYFTNPDEPIIPGEANVLTFNFAPGLKNGNLLTETPIVTVTTYAGTDPDPSAILVGDPQIDDTRTLVLQAFAANVDMTQYLFLAKCPTEQSTVLLEAQGVLPVSSKPSSSCAC